MDIHTQLDEFHVKYNIPTLVDLFLDSYKFVVGSND